MKITKRKLLKILNSAEPSMEGCKKTVINGIVVGDLQDIWNAMLQIAATGGASKPYVDGQDALVLQTCENNLEDAEARFTVEIGRVDSAITTKQDSLVSGTNIKTINGNDILGSGDITIGGGTPSHYLKTLNISGNTMTFRKVVDGTEEDQSYTPNFDTTYVGISNVQTITGAKNFTGALTQNNDPVVTSSMLSTYEKVANKTTTISASSTDTQYPTAKAVYDYIQSLDGNTIDY